MTESSRLHVELDDPSRSYTPGQTIEGVVRVVLDAPMTCDRLVLTPRWTTGGRGNRAGGAGPSIVCHRGAWSAGEHRYSFSLPCPDAPLSHVGKLLRVDWKIEARAEIPRAIDLETEAELRVRAGPDVEVAVRPLPRTRASAAPDLAIAAAIALLVLVPSVALARLVPIARPLSWALALVAVPVLVLLVRVARLRLTHRGFSRLDVRLERPSPQQLIVQVDHRARSRLASVVLRLVVEERVVAGEGPDKREHTHRLHEATKVFRVGRHDVPPDTHRAQFELPDPRVLGWSFDTPDNALRWFIEVEFQQDGHADHTERIPFEVLPTAHPRTPYRSAG